MSNSELLIEYIIGPDKGIQGNYKRADVPANIPYPAYMEEGIRWFAKVPKIQGHAAAEMQKSWGSDKT